MTRPVTSQRFRQRKLNTRAPLQVLREEQLEAIDPEQPNTPKVETGVEKHEEHEHHLQAAISASHAAAIGGNVAQIFIPTPETVQASTPYSQLYQLKFSQPATYIRFSSTVEDCCGCPYNMVEEDDAFLKELNERPASKKVNPAQCSEDTFEEVIYFFELAAKTLQPFSGVGDPPPILTWEELHGAFDENIDELPRTFAQDIYEHWNARRSSNDNTALQPGLKLKVIETANDADDNDPYVCFRRREVRQVRKTRGRDAQSVEKLKKLRKELEDARQLVALVRQREVLKKDSLAADRHLFEQRSNLRGLKKSLPEQYRDGDEDLLINQKPVKKKPTQPTEAQRQAAAALRAPAGGRPDRRSSEADLVQLADLIAEKENEIEREIKTKIAQHQRWNENYVDRTRHPLTPPLEENFNPSFRPAVTEYLPTPPASGSSEHSATGPPRETKSPSRPGSSKQDAVAVRYATPTLSGPRRGQIAFRRRVGRGGRQMIDRRSMHPALHEKLPIRLAERFKYDEDDEDDDENAIISTDPYNISSMRYRAAIAGTHQHHAAQQAQRRAQLDAQQAASSSQQQQSQQSQQSSQSQQSQQQSSQPQQQAQTQAQTQAHAQAKAKAQAQAQVQVQQQRAQAAS